MNLLLNKNLKLFQQRFPQLAEELIRFSKTVEHKSYLPPDVQLELARNSCPTASYNGILLHSKYDPEKESEKQMDIPQILESKNIVFMGFGLGYGPIALAKKYPEKKIVLIENNPLWVLFAFSILDWEPVLQHPYCVFFIETPYPTIIGLLERMNLRDCYFTKITAHMAHSGQWFANLFELIQRNKQKYSINKKTQSTFGLLWLRNMSKNLEWMGKLDGICRYKDKGENVTALILAAGPSLDTMLPYLKQLKEGAILICVETALRACLSVGVEPDFIVLVDPQYWNARHLDGLASPSSILITESAAYPSIFRFKCKEKILCSSLFALGKYIETYTGKNGELSPGGSVATTAWEFARFSGCKSIYVIGLDLGFPQKKTHFKGSIFEERCHSQSNRLYTAETQNTSFLNSTTVTKVKDYKGRMLLSDKRMGLYGWWFESRCAAYPQIHTYSLTSESRAIPGIESATIENFLQTTTNAHNAKKEFLSIPRNNQSRNREILLQKALHELKTDFNKLDKAVEAALEICLKTYFETQEYAKAVSDLEELNKEIKNSRVAEISNLLFPSEEEIEKETAKIYSKPSITASYSTKCQYELDKGKIIYAYLKDSIKTHISLLFL